MTRVRFFRSFLLAAAMGLAAAGCSTTTTAPTNFAPFLESDLVLGTGDPATAGSTVTVDYTGWLYDETAPDHKGPQFDSSIGRSPFVFALGSGQVIKGWDQGVVGMRVGGTRRLVIPPSLAYGSDRSGIIPPNATLVFDIKLLAVGTQ